MPDTVIINVITPPQQPVDIEVTEDPTVEVDVNFETGPPGPQGPPGDSANLLFGESPIGLINGSNATFTTPFNFVPGKLEVFVNGLLQKLVTHYQTSGVNTIIFNDSPQTGDIILLNFIKP